MTQFMQHRLLLALTVPALLVASACTPVSSRIPGYLTTPKGQLLRNEAGQCWRTVEWRPALARKECDPEIVARLAMEAEAAKAEEEAAAAEEEKPEEEVRPRGRRYAGTEAHSFVPNLFPDDELAVASGREVVGADGKTRTEIVFAPLNLSSDTSFRFGDDRLTVDARDRLTELAGTLKRRGAKDISIDIVGHTDRIGSASANLALSRRRAESVKAHLVKEGLPAAGIRTAGMGASKPVTDRADCPDDIAKCELIECLRPDRRVEIRIKAQVDSGKRTTVPAEKPVPKPQSLRLPAQEDGTRQVRVHDSGEICRA